MKVNNLQQSDIEIKMVANIFLIEIQYEQHLMRFQRGGGGGGGGGGGEGLYLDPKKIIKTD